MLYLLARVEETPLSSWLRESGPAFFSSLALHSLAMAVVVGINCAVAFRLLGIVPAYSLQRFQPFYRLNWLGVVLILLSGTALLLAYPAKALTNPVFYGKLTALLAALLLFRNVQQHARQTHDLWGSEKRIGMVLLALWVGVLFAGRFLAYTHSILLASSFH